MKTENKTVIETLKTKGSIHHLGLFVQIVLLMMSVLLLIMRMFIPELELVVEAVFALLLFTIAYNNHVVYKRNYLTIIYVLAGVLLIGASILSVVYGI